MTSSVARAAAILVAALLLPVSTVPAAAASSSGVASPGAYTRLTQARRFNLGDLRARTPVSGAPVSLPFHPGNPAAHAQAKAHPIGSGARLVTPSSSVPRISIAPRAGAPLSEFPLISHDQEPDVEPPDTSLAVGPTWGVEMVNTVGRVFDLSTGANRSTNNFDLTAFFNGPTTAGWQFSDPRVFYDRFSARWFASGMSFHVTGPSAPPDAGRVYIAVSQGSDPGTPGTAGSGPWAEWVLYDSGNSGRFCDQPQLGFSNDKVVLACVDFAGQNSIGQRLWVLSKAAMLQGPSPIAYASGPDANVLGEVPAVSLGQTSDEWVAYHNPTATTLGLLRITGNPQSATVQVSASAVPIGAWSIPPPAVQPPPLTTPPTAACTAVSTGPNSCIDTGDDRVLTTVWQGGLLWTAGNDGCVPGPDTAVRSCMRLIQVDTQAAAPTVRQDVDLGLNGKSVYYPAVTNDAFGDTFVGFTHSSASENPSVQGIDQPAGTQGFSQPTVLQAGAARYAAGRRWGDYSAAVPDPCVPNQAWLGGQYVAAATDRGWGTAAARVSDRLSPMQAMAMADAYGAIHDDAGCPPTVPTLWPGWKIANGAAWQFNTMGGYILDGYGGLHEFGGAPHVSNEAYWGGWNIARDVVLLPTPGQGYTLDGWGGLHAFGGAPAPRMTGFWPNWDIAKRAVMLSDGTGGYVMDGWGGLHAFAVGANPMPPRITNEGYWPNWNIARGIALTPNATATAVSGVTLDGFGGVHPFGTAGSVGGEAYWGGWDIARDVVLVPNPPGAAPQGYTLDGWGGVHPFGGVPSVQTYFYTPNQDFARRLAALSVLQG